MNSQVRASRHLAVRIDRELEKIHDDNADCRALCRAASATLSDAGQTQWAEQLRAGLAAAPTISAGEFASLQRLCAEQTALRRVVDDR